MASSGVMSSFRRGLLAGLPFLPVVIPFAMLFGVVATEAGLNVFETFSFSAMVFAGAAQFTALQLMQDNTPTVIVLISALAVNLRLAMYSASITPYLGALPLWKRVITAYFLVDQTYAGSVLEYEKRPKLGMSERWAFFLGITVPICPTWFIATLVGAWAGAAIPPEAGLDFALPITFLAMIGPALRTPAHRIAALVATVLALLFGWVPFNLGLIIGGLGGMIAGAEAERRGMGTPLFEERET